VKTATLSEGATDFPDHIAGAAWGPQQDRILAGIYHGLYLVGYRRGSRTLVRIDFVPPHIIEATPNVFEPRKPLSDQAKRAGWTGFLLNVSALPKVGIRRVYPAS
jgi:type II restriction enzyme